MSFRSVLAPAAGLLMLITVPVAAQEAPTDPAVERLRQIVQMPIAVDKVVSQAGADPLEVARVAQALNDGGVEPATFNRTLHDVSRTRVTEGPRDLGRTSSVGEFAVARLQEGLRGQALAEAIRGHLRTEYGVPAGNRGVTGPAPVAQNFVPEAVREATERRRAEEAERRGGSAADRPGRSRRPGVGAGSPGGPAGAPGGAGRR